MTLKARISYILNHISSIGLAATFYYFLQRLIIRKGSLIKIKIKGVAHPIYLRSRSYDIHIFYQIFVARELEFSLRESIVHIIDLGANIGLSSIFLKKRFPESHILCVEPSTDNLKILKKNLHSYKNIEIFHGAVYSKDTEIFLIDTGKGEASYQVREAHHLIDTMPVVNQVNCLSIDTLLRRYHLSYIDFIKMDIEGAEEDCLLSTTNWLNNVDFLAVEIHDLIKPGLSKLICNRMGEKFKISQRGEYTLFERV
jgi:FkbM family methyltransferase